MASPRIEMPSSSASRGMSRAGAILMHSPPTPTGANMRSPLWKQERFTARAASDRVCVSPAARSGLPRPGPCSARFPLREGGASASVRGRRGAPGRAPAAFSAGTSLREVLQVGNSRGHGEAGSPSGSMSSSRAGYSSMTSGRTDYRDRGREPEIPLPQAMRSGRTPSCSNANHVPVRPNPAWTSSTIEGRRCPCTRRQATGVAVGKEIRS